MFSTTKSRKRRCSIRRSSSFSSPCTVFLRGRLANTASFLRHNYYNPMEPIFKLYSKLEKYSKHLAKNNHRIAAAIISCMLLVTQSAFAQFDKAIETINGYGPQVKKLCYVIAGCIVFVGALNVGNKMWNGDQDVKKTIMLTLGGAIAMVALSEALPLFFKL